MAVGIWRKATSKLFDLEAKIANQVGPGHAALGTVSPAGVRGGSPAGVRGASPAGVGGWEPSWSLGVKPPPAPVYCAVCLGITTFYAGLGHKRKVYSGCTEC